MFAMQVNNIEQQETADEQADPLAMEDDVAVAYGMPGVSPADDQPHASNHINALNVILATTHLCGGKYCFIYQACPLHMLSLVFCQCPQVSILHLQSLWYFEYCVKRQARPLQMISLMLSLEDMSMH